MPLSNVLVSRRNFAAARALCSAMAIEPSCAPSMRANATRLAPESTIATFNFQPRFFDSATAALIAACARSSEIAAPYGMSFGILSGTASRGFGCAGCCAPAPSANRAAPIANAVRIDRMCFLLWLRATFARTLAEGFYARGRDLFVFMRLHAGHADAAYAGALDHDRQAALHWRDLRHAQHRIAAALDAFFPDERRAARFRRRLALRDCRARIEGRRAVHAHEMQQMPAIVEDGDRYDPVVLLSLAFRRRGNFPAV